MGCTKKLVFNSESDARANISVRDWRNGEKGTPYKCSECALWHITSN